MMEDIKKIYEMLREKGFRITDQKKIILDVFLTNQDRMLSVCDVYKMLPEGVRMDNATVYRNIQKFLDIGLLESMTDDCGIKRYTICEKEQHHYLICTECGRIIKFPCNRNFWDNYAIKNGFLETHHKLEIYGKCAECRRLH